MTRQRVVVTGSDGYIGSVLTPHLRAEGFEVAELDLGLYAACKFPHGESPLRPWDARHSEPQDFAGADAVVHLAALSNDPLGDLDPNLTYQINLEGTIRAAAAAKEAGVSRFIFASSCSLYGSSGDVLADETSPMAPLTPYAETKVKAEAELSALADDRFSPTYMRNATVYGFSPALRLDLVVNDLCATAIASGKVTLKSDGSAWRPQVHVSDVARSIVAALEAPRESVHNEAVNIGRSDDNLRVIDIAKAVGELSGAEIEFATGATADTRSYRVDFSKVGRLLPSFSPQRTVRDGIAELLEAFGRAGLAPAQYSRYRRLEEIRRLKELGRLTDTLNWASD